MGRLWPWPLFLHSPFYMNWKHDHEKLVYNQLWHQEVLMNVCFQQRGSRNSLVFNIKASEKMAFCEKSLLKIIVENLKIYYDVLKKINSKYFFNIKTCSTNINLKFAIPCLTKTILLHKNDLWILTRDVRIKLKLL